MVADFGLWEGDLMKVRSDSLVGGEVFGRLTVVRYHHSSRRRDGSAGERMMLCKCECGSEKVVKTSNLKSGTTKSCGCLHSDLTSKSNRDREGLKGDSDIAYSCGSCGCVSFNILRSGMAECCKCKSRERFSIIFKLNKPRN